MARRRQLHQPNLQDRALWLFGGGMGKAGSRLDSALRPPALHTGAQHRSAFLHLIMNAPAK